MGRGKCWRVDDRTMTCCRSVHIDGTIQPIHVLDDRQTERETTVERERTKKGLIPIDFFSPFPSPLAKVVMSLPPHWSGGARLGGAGWREKEGQEGRGGSLYLPQIQISHGTVHVRDCSFLPVDTTFYPHKQSSALHTCHLPACTLLIRICTCLPREPGTGTIYLLT